MKRAKQPTPYLLIKANTRADYDPINYAIIQLSPEWLELVSYRLYTIEEFYAGQDFHCLSYWDAPLGYFHIPDHQILEHDLMPAHQDQSFITLESAELDGLQWQGNRLEAQQLLITKAGIAHFKAYAYGSREEYWTEEFNLNRLIRPYQKSLARESAAS